MKAIILAAGYCAGLVLLFAKQRSMLFPIPTTEHIAPAAAGFPQAEEHVRQRALAGSDRPGHADALARRDPQ